MRKGTCCAMVLAWAACVPAYAVFVPLDDFNRPNTTNMAPNWTERVPDLRIEDNRARAISNALMTFEAPTGLAAQDAVSVTAIHSGETTSVQYVALVLGYADNANNVFIKIQDNNQGGAFNRIYFNRGNNAGAWAGMTGGASFIIIPPTTHARIRAAINGAEVTVQVDGDNDGSWEQTYVRGGLPTEGLGSRIGLGGFGNAAMDDFGGYAGEFPIPEPSAALMLLAGFIAFRRRRA